MKNHKTNEQDLSLKGRDIGLSQSGLMNTEVFKKQNIIFNSIMSNGTIWIDVNPSVDIAIILKDALDLSVVNNKAVYFEFMMHGIKIEATAGNSAKLNGEIELDAEVLWEKVSELLESENVYAEEKIGDIHLKLGYHTLYDGGLANVSRTVRIKSELAKNFQN